MKSLMIALIPGHDEKSSGAVNYKKESEYSWASRILIKVKKILDQNYTVGIIDRNKGRGISGALKLAGEMSSTISLELHFNAASGNPKGCEALALRGNKEQFLFADYMTDALNLQYGFIERANDGVVEVASGQRAFENVAKIKSNGIKYGCLLEPCFSHKSPDAEKVFSNDNLFAETIAKAIDYFIRKHIAVNTPINADGISPKFIEMVKAYRSFPIEKESLKVVTVAQWLLESGKGLSELFQKYNNAGGMKWRVLNPIVKGTAPVEYKACDGIGTYASCDSFETFFRYYWAFIGRSPYKGWQNHDSIDYIQHIKDNGYAQDKAYVGKVESLLPLAKRLLESV